MRNFDTFIAIDWSGAKSARHKAISIAVASSDGGPPVMVERTEGWSRNEVLSVLRDDLPDNALVGLDLGISLPFADCDAFFPGWDETPADAKSLWALVDTMCEADKHLGASSIIEHSALGEYFHHGHRIGSHYSCDGAGHANGRLRVTETEQQRYGCRPTSNFKLVGPSQVGKSSLTGMRVLHRLNGKVPVWPIDPVPTSGPLIVEIYTGLAALDAKRLGGRTKLRNYEELNVALEALDSPPVTGHGKISDHDSDALLSAAWMRTAAFDEARWDPKGLKDEIAQTEGWTFGVS